MIPTKILIIDDDKWLVDQQSSFLTSKGYQVRYCYDALSAFSLIDKDLPDVMILDVLLSSQTILNLIHELRSYSDTSGIPIILCTNLADSLKGIDLAPYGIAQVLDKATISPQDLILAIEEVRHELKN